VSRVLPCFEARFASTAPSGNQSRPPARSSRDSATRPSQKSPPSSAAPGRQAGWRPGQGPLPYAAPANFDTCSGRAAMARRGANRSRSARRVRATVPPQRVLPAAPSGKSCPASRATRTPTGSGPPGRRWRLNTTSQLGLADEQEGGRSGIRKGSRPARIRRSAGPMPFPRATLLGPMYDGVPRMFPLCVRLAVPSSSLLGRSRRSSARRGIPPLSDGLLFAFAFCSRSLRVTLGAGRWTGFKRGERSPAVGVCAWRGPGRDELGGRRARQ